MPNEAATLEAIPFTSGSQWIKMDKDISDPNRSLGVLKKPMNFVSDYQYAQYTNDLQRYVSEDCQGRTVYFHARTPAQPVCNGTHPKDCRLGPKFGPNCSGLCGHCDATSNDKQRCNLALPGDKIGAFDTYLTSGRDLHFNFLRNEFTVQLTKELDQGFKWTYKNEGGDSAWIEHG